MVKLTKRCYDSTGRRGQAALTRSRIMDAARRLFAERGLDQVTIEMLATEAGVSAATIYAIFTSKAGLLKAMMESFLFNDSYQGLAGKVDGECDPVEVLRMTASIARAIYDGEKAQLGLVRGASAFSSELRDVEQQFERLRYDLQGPRLRRLARAGSLRPGLNRARDILWMFTGRDVYRMLVVERGWNSEAYETWLFDTLQRALLSHPGD